MLENIWNHESVREVALECKTRTEFRVQYGGAYTYCQTNGIYAETVSHIPKQFTSWTHETVKEAALDCNNKTEFQKKYSGAKKYAIRHHIYDEITSHFDTTYWSISKITNKAKNYDDYTKFHLDYASGIRYAHKMGILDEITSHMKKRNVWNHKSVREVALECKTRTELNEKYPGAVDYAKRNGIHDEITSHIKTQTNLYRRHIYEIIFHDVKACYIGLTYNIKKRIASHLNGETNKHVKELLINGEKYEVKVDDDTYDINEVGKIEGDRIKLRESEGWNILNIAKAGSLGTVAFHSYEKVKNLALKYPTKTMFARRQASAVKFAIKHGFYAEITSHMNIKKVKKKKKKVFRWNHDSVREKALTCKTRKEFERKYSGALKYSHRHGIYKEVTNHMPNLKPPRGK